MRIPIYGLVGFLLMGCSQSLTTEPIGALAGAPGNPGSGGSISDPSTGNPIAPLVLPDASTSMSTRWDAAEAAICGMPEFKLERSPVDVMLVLDVSSSLKAGTSFGGSRWEIVTPPVREIVKQTQHALNWGVKTFPVIGNLCAVSESVDIPIAPNNYPAVDQLITEFTPPEGDGTPTGTAIDVAVKYLKSLKSLRPQYLVLATDGDPSCSYQGKDKGDEFAHVEAVRLAANQGIATFVIGVSEAVSSSKLLTAMAAAGGRGRKVDPLREPMFYAAANQQELLTAMQAITNQIISCVFALESPPPSPADVAADIIRLDSSSKEIKARAPRDLNHVEGWDYADSSNRAIEFFGSWCDQVRDIEGKGNRVQFTFGCPGIVIP
jgi:hypothetical protein